MTLRQISLITARRLAVASQQLTGAYPEATKEKLLNVLRCLRCLQLDPIRAVERTQYLVLWSRLGSYDRQYLHQLVYEDRLLFEYWAHAASLVLTEDFPLHEHFMRHYAGSGRSRRLVEWVAENEAFKQYILDELKARGPLLTSDFEDKTKVPWSSSGWTSGRSVAYMLDYLWTTGEVLVSQRQGLKRWWDLAERVLPVSHRVEGGWTAEEVTWDAAQKALKALGVGRLRDIRKHFIERRYHQLGDVLRRLAVAGLICPVRIADWAETWYIHTDALPLLEQIEDGLWQPRTVLLSPFDNLIRDRERMQQLWNFYYRIEIYVPRAKRQYGYYVLPILHGDQLVGRVSPKMDRRRRVLEVEAIYLEDSIPPDEEMGLAVAESLRQLARFLAAERLSYGSTMPPSWRPLLTEVLDP